MLGRFDLLGSPPYAWPLLAAGARACGAALTVRDLAGRARRLLGRLRTQAWELASGDDGEFLAAHPAEPFMLVGLADVMRQEKSSGDTMTYFPDGP